MHLVSASKAGMNAARDQSSMRTFGDRHLQPSAGGRVKRTPCLQQCLPFKRQAMRLAAKLRVHTRSFKRSKSTLSFLRVCRTLRRNEPRRSKQEESPDESKPFKSQSKSSYTKSKQNNSPKFPSQLFQEIYHGNEPINAKKSPNCFAVFLPYGPRFKARTQSVSYVKFKPCGSSP